jgi:hypothetical protein
MSSRPPTDHGAEDPQDEGDLPGGPGDEGLLTMVRSLFEAVDPVPAGLVERIRFSVALAGLEGEVARLAEQEAEVSQLYEHEGGLALARGAPEESRTITFDSTNLTIMIRIDSNADGTARVDGWLAPPRRCQVRARGHGPDRGPAAGTGRRRRRPGGGRGEVGDHPGARPVTGPVSAGK